MPRPLGVLIAALATAILAQAIGVARADAAKVSVKGVVLGPRPVPRGAGSPVVV